MREKEHYKENEEEEEEDGNERTITLNMLKK